MLTCQPSRAELKKQFCSITNALSEVAAKYLEKFHWDIYEATNAYLNKNYSLTPRTSVAPSKALIDLYNKYKDPEDDSLILIDGTLAYLEDLNIDPEDPRSLTLAFLLGSPQTGEFSKARFLEFWAQNRVSSISQMKTLIDNSHKQIKESPQVYEEFYRYCFEFIRGSDTRIKSITHEDAISYWALLFGERKDLASCMERLDQWFQFLRDTKRPISKDTWIMFYKFLTQVVKADPLKLSGYDEMSSWPSMVDEYVEWLRENLYLEDMQLQ